MMRGGLSRWRATPPFFIARKASKSVAYSVISLDLAMLMMMFFRFSFSSYFTFVIVHSVSGFFGSSGSVALTRGRVLVLRSRSWPATCWAVMLVAAAWAWAEAILVLKVVFRFVMFLLSSSSFSFICLLFC